jgi:beta-lactam-binding protein with PASTA domain
LNGHAVRLDANNKLLAWPSVQANAYDQVLALATNYLLTGVPTGPAGLPYYYVYSYGYPGNPVRPEGGWPHNPAGLFAMFTDSGLAYYAYSGNVAMMNLVRDVLTYHLDHGMTPSNWNWPGVPFASAEGGSLTYQGAHYGDSSGSGDGFGVIEPDKIGELAVAFVQYYQYSGVTRFRDAAIQAADVLAAHIRTGDATHSPWPFRVYGQTNAIREEYSAHVISPIRLFDNLIRLNLGNTAAYQSARQTAWNWLMTYPMTNNVWANYFEDVTIKSNLSNTNQLNAAETARYLMQHPEFDPNWQTHVRGIISWIETTFASQQYGANTIAEQQSFYYPMGSHTSRYASINAQLYELTGDQAALEKAYRSFNWATYMCGSDGVVIDGPSVNHVWWTDGYGDYIKHFMEGLGSVPQWAPQGQSHLLRSTSVIRAIQYSATQITYQTADGASQEVLRLNFTPQSVTADSFALPNRSDLTQEGWTFDSATGVMRIRHDSGTALVISGSPSSGNQPPDVRLDAPAPGTYSTTSLSLSATASDVDGTIDHVDFLSNGTVLGTTTTQPYQYTWTSVPPGTYQLTAAAVDNQGARVTSAPVSVTVTSPSPPPSTLNVDGVVFSDGTSTRTSPPISTTSSNSLLLAFAASDGPSSGQTLTVSGAGLTWTLVTRVTTQPGSSEIWKAVAPNTLTNATVTSTPTRTGYHQSLTVVIFSGSGGTGAIATGSAPSGAPSVSLTTTRAGSLVFGVGNDWQQAVARTVGSNQSMVHQWVDTSAGDTFWVQRRTTAISAAGTLVQLNDTAPTTDRWNFAAVEVLAAAPPATVSVPDVVGQPQASAESTITGAGLTVGTKTSEASSTTPIGAVIRQSPVAGSQVASGSPVALVISTGVTVPNVVGQPRPTAESMITNAGLSVGTVTTQSDSTVPAGNVISQNPAASTQASPGAPVALVVSSGPESVTVPDVVGRTQSNAQSMITAADLQVGAVTNQQSTSAPMGTVVSQNPAATTQVPAGSSVALVVSSGVTVPNVVGQQQSTAQSMINQASLTVGTVTSQSSTSVPNGAVISQNPAANTQASAGSAVNLVVSSGPPPQAVPTVDRTIFSDGVGTRTTAPFSTTAANELLLAFGSADGPSSGSQSLTISGAGLTWTLVRRVNTQHGSSEVWKATASSVLTNVTVTSTPALGGYRQSLTVVAFKGASGVGASAGANATSGGPAVSLTTTRANSLVYGVGNDWDRALSRTVGSSQTMVHEVVDSSVGDTFWVQARTTASASAGTVVQINDTSPTSDRWNLVAVEIIP